MIDLSLLHDMNPQAKPEVEKAIALLTNCGLWEQQIQLEQDILLNGPSNQPTEELAEAIKLFRLRRGIYLELHELGEQIGRALTDDDQSTDSAA